MKALVPKQYKVMDLYKNYEFQSDYKKKVQDHQYQGFHGLKGKYYGAYASTINPYTGSK